MTRPSHRPRDLRVRGVVAAAGVAAIVVAWYAVPLGLDSQPGLGTGELLLAGAGAAVVAIAAAWRRAGAAYRLGAVTLVSSLLLLGALELGARGVSSLIARSQEAGLASSAAYAGEPWAATYWREHDLASRKRYVPYVGWRRAPFAGETVNVDGRGHRVTPGARCVPGAWTVFVFGGSTMWGWGSPDALTVPARLQAQLDRERAGDVCVVNFGEDAFTTTQHLVELTLELQAGRIPDVVVLSIGLNDVDAAAANGRAVDHRYTRRFADRLERDDASVGNPLRESALVDLLRRAAGGGPPAEPLRLDGVEPGALADDVVAAVAGATRIIDALGARFGFERTIVWHPGPFAGAKRLTAEERAALEATDPRLVALYRRVYERAARQAADDPRTAVLTDIYDDVAERVYLDIVHVTPRGNALLAEAIAARLDPALPSTGSATGGTKP